MIIKLVLLVLISSLLISQQPQVARNRQYFFHQLNYDFPVLWGRYDMQFDVKFNYFQLLQRLSDAHHGADPIE